MPRSALETEAPADADYLDRLIACRRCGRRWGLALGLLLVVAAALGADYWFGLPEDAHATYVGRSRCVECHQQEAKLWTGSHHDQAMDHATDATVLGDFNDATFEHHGIVSRMFRRGEKFFINTEGPDGKLADFEVKYTFGVTPLQQYLVEFDRPEDMPPHEVAQLQTLRVSWDTLKKKWFYLPPPDVSEKLDPGDDLHWTGIAQRWNTMCADCHSTNLKKNFDVATTSYRTTWSEIDVSCEACHGPGSLHVQLAESPGLFKWDRVKKYALAELKGKDSLDNQPEIETCAACHSRRSVIDQPFPGGKEFHNFFAVSSLLEEGTYHADGQILDEVYEFGSFCQSKMYHKGIRCSDCHNPHSLKLKFEGNKLCTSCHAHPASRYDILSHHHHRDGSAGALCVNCHMPATTYMEVDPRRDHSLRMPRPDLSVKLNTPNACTGCHVGVSAGIAVNDEAKTKMAGKEYSQWLRAAREGDKLIAGELATVDQWAADKVVEWYGPNRKSNVPHFAAELAAARKRGPDEAEHLLKLLADKTQPEFARATAAQELAPFVNRSEVAKELGKVVGDEKSGPILRGAAVRSLAGADLSVLQKFVIPQLSDPIRSVRIDAARDLAGIPEQDLNREDAERRKLALAQYDASVLMNNDRASAHLVLGSLFEEVGSESAAEAAYRDALRVEPTATGARRNLANILDQRLGRFLQQAQELAQQGKGVAAEKAHQQAIALEKEVVKLRSEELELLQRDAKLAPDNAFVQHNLGLALYLEGQRPEARAALEKAVTLSPENDRFAYILAVFYRDTGEPKLAVAMAERALNLRPDLPQYVQFVRELLQPQEK